ncbi:hypothetical protein Q2941_02000 [Bradyrhizobium sp. UFLA05-153]
MTSRAVEEFFDQTPRFVWSAVRAKRHEGVGGTCQERSSIGDVAFAFHIEPPEEGWLPQPLQPLQHRGFDGVAGLPCIVQQCCRSAGPRILDHIGYSRRQDVEQQPGDMTFESCGDLADSGQPREVSCCPIQPNQDVLDHNDLAGRRQHAEEEGPLGFRRRSKSGGGKTRGRDTDRRILPVVQHYE